MTGCIFDDEEDEQPVLLSVSPTTCTLPIPNIPSAICSLLRHLLGYDKSALIINDKSWRTETICQSSAEFLEILRFVGHRNVSDRLVSDVIS